MKLLALLGFFVVTSGFADCIRSPLCDELNDLSFDCGETYKQETCEKFVETFEKALAPQVCDEPKTKSRRILEFCVHKAGNPFISIYYDRLAELPFGKGIKLYSSQKLRDSMDGQVAEAHLERSKEDEKEFGKTLLAGFVLSQCRDIEELKFSPAKLKDYSYEEAKVGDFSIWGGDVPKRIVNLKTKHVCEVKVGIITNVSKFVGQDLLLYETYNGSENKKSIVGMKDCSILWESQSYAAETSTGETRPVVKINRLKDSWKTCAPCWDQKHAACLKI